MPEARHLRIGFQPAYPPSDIISSCIKHYHGPGMHDGNRLGWRDSDVYDSSEAVAFAHLQLGVVEDVSGWIRKGLDASLHYFLDPWWVGDANSSSAVNKSDPDRWLRWYKAFSRGLLLGLLAEDWAAVSRLCVLPFSVRAPDRRA